jgi:hypothetical protein
VVVRSPAAAHALVFAARGAIARIERERKNWNRLREQKHH